MAPVHRRRILRFSARWWLVPAALSLAVLVVTLWSQGDYRQVQEELRRLVLVLRREGVRGAKPFLTDDFVLIVDQNVVPRELLESDEIARARLHLELGSHTPSRASEDQIRLESTFRLRGIDLGPRSDRSLVGRVIGQVARMLADQRSMAGRIETLWVTTDRGRTYRLRSANVQELRGAATRSLERR